MSLMVFVLVVVGCNHWVGGLVGASIWFVWRIRQSGEIPVPPVWQAWVVAVLALLGGTILSSNPSGLQWAGFLQWLSLLGGVWALQDLLRKHPEIVAPAIWGLLGAGGVDAAIWTWDSLLEYWKWWTLRTDGLPLFPFRIRLFGSHGSTQAAAWLSGLILLGLSWSPRWSDHRFARVGWASFLVLLSILLGLCDSRLAYAGLLAGLVVRKVLLPKTDRRHWLALIPALVWWSRDLAHPSLVGSGGGFGWGGMTVALIIFVLLVEWAISRKIRRDFVDASLVRKGVLASALIPVLLPILAMGFSRIPSLNAVSTGRISFWSVAFESWLGSPILGIGPWTYVHKYASTVDWTFGFLAMHPHNAFLDVLLAGGGVLVISLAAIFVASTMAPTSEILEGFVRRIAPTAIGLSVGMAFDSPLSSPQVMALVTVCAAIFLAACPHPGSVRTPRTLVLAPLLLLVPFSVVWERQLGKAPLLAASELLKAQRWKDAAEMILAESGGAPDDPQWTRNTLMARTMLADSPDSLVVLRQEWSRQVARESGYFPNQVHLRWVQWRMSQDSASADSLRASLQWLGHANKGLPTFGQTAPSWKDVYPTDNPSYWHEQLDEARRTAMYKRERWIEAWLETRFPAGSVGRNARLLVTGARGVAEFQLYGSVGTRWLLIPQIVSIQETME